jgi:hypothetical protein
VGATKKGTTIVVTVGGLGGPNSPPVPLEIRSNLGFEVLTYQGKKGKGGVHPGVWQATPIKSLSGVELTLDATNATDGVAIRYLWYTTPCGIQPYQCPVYARVEPLKGGLSGELGFLPLGPFIMNLSSS